VIAVDLRERYGEPIEIVRASIRRDRASATTLMARAIATRTGACST
jgi:hypothetical protein